MTDIIEQAADARRQAVQRGQRAAVELPLTDEFFARMREALIEKWASTAVDHTASREKMFFAVQAIDSVHKALKRAVQDGKLELHSQEMAALLSPAQSDRR